MIFLKKFYYDKLRDTFFIFILLDVLPGSMSYLTLPTINVSNTFTGPFTLLLQVLHYLKLYHSSWLLCPFFHSFLTLHFSLELSIDLSSSYLILPLTVCSLEICPTKVFFISVTMFLIPFWIFLRVSIFLLSLSSVLACCLHYN